jgi:hypothetical protein
MKKKPITNKSYAANPRCPNCKSLHTECTGNEDETFNKKGVLIGEKIQLQCTECSAIWTEVSRVVGYENLYFEDEEDNV